VWWRVVAVGVLVGAGLEGCAGYKMVTGGVATGLGEGSHRLAGTVDAEIGGSMVTSRLRRSPAMLALGVHGRFGDDIVQVAPTLTLRALPALGRVMLFGGLGFRMFQVESARGEAGFGMFSPLADLGAMVLLPGQPYGETSGGRRFVGGWVFVLRGAIGYDLRFTSQPSEGWASATAGLGVVFGGE